MNKNLKKILTVLPLLLVMVLVTLPVSAECEWVLEQGSEFKLTDAEEIFSDRFPNFAAPIWVGEVVPAWELFLDKKVLKTPNNQPVRLMNNGEPVTRVTYTPGLYSDVDLARAIVAEHFPQYELVDQVANSIPVVDKTVRGRCVATTKTYKYNVTVKEDVEEAKVVVDEGHLFQFSSKENCKTQLEQAGCEVVGDPIVAKGVITANVKQPQLDDKGELKKDDKGNVLVASQGVTFTVVDEKEDGLDTKADFSGIWKSDSDISKLVVHTDKEVTKEKTIKNTDKNFKDVFVKYKDGLLTYKDAEGKHTVPATLTVEREEGMCDNLCKGLLIIVQKAKVDVTINHHYQLASGEEITEKSAAEVGIREELTPETVNPAWYAEKAPLFVIDNTKTKVTPKNGNPSQSERFYGAVQNEGWVVDLYYTAAEDADDSDLEAAFNDTNAGVANADNAVSLPATGSASDLLALTASAVAVALGFLLKK